MYPRALVTPGLTCRHVMRVSGLLVLLSGVPASAQTPPPGYEGFQQSVFLPYLNAEGGEIEEIPRIGLSFGDRVHRAVLDSGSTGIVVAADAIPDFDDLPSDGPGRLTYTSSGRVMLGQWVTTPLTLVGGDGTELETEPMPVLAVTEVKCRPKARNCEPTDEPRNIFMVGIGFGREGDSQTQSTPDKNPLLRVAGGHGAERHGYVLTREGVHVGLTAADTQGFDFIKLERQPDIPDWSAVPACISLDGQTPPACGTMLVDTGVSVMYMTVPPTQADDDGGSLPDGTDVSIRLGTDERAQELYRFTVGEDSPMSPEDTHLRVSPTRVFVNTSFYLLNGFDVLYDADGGYAGFRPR